MGHGGGRELCPRAGLGRLVLDESAALLGLSAATAYLDIEKFYDHVNLALLSKQRRAAVPAAAPGHFAAIIRRREGRQIRVMQLAPSVAAAEPRARLPEGKHLRNHHIVQSPRECPRGFSRRTPLPIRRRPRRQDGGYGAAGHGKPPGSSCEPGQQPEGTGVQYLQEIGLQCGADDLQRTGARLCGIGGRTPRRKGGQ